MKMISVIINNFNTRDILKKCIENLLSQGVNLEVIIHDSGSTDGSADMVEKYFRNENNVKLVRNKNVGVASGYNFAIEKAVGDYYLFLGTDSFPKKDSLEGLVEYFEDKRNKKVGMATVKLVTRDGNLDMDAHRGTLTPWVAFTHFSGLDRIFKKSKLFNKYFLGYEDFNKPHEIGACISHFMFVRKETLKQVGKWDDNFFVYGEDIDFCYRVLQKGYKIMYLPQWTVLHIKGVGMGRKTGKDIENASKFSEIAKYVLSKERTRAMKLYFNKHLRKHYPTPVVLLVDTGIFILEKVRTIVVGFQNIKK